MSIQSLYFSPYSSLAAQAVRSGAAQQSQNGINGVDAQNPIEEITKVGKQPNQQDDQNGLDLKPGELASPAGDILSISDKAKEADTEEQERLKSGGAADGDGTAIAQHNNASQDNAAKTVGAEEDLTEEEEQQVNELKTRDTEVKNHEAAHLAAAGQYATSGASYTYQTGPDGKKYAVGGEVSIDTSPVDGNPEATIQKAQQVRAAALAPASPSSQDYKVAANASKMEAEARAELREKQMEETEQTQNGETANQMAASDLDGPMNQKQSSVAAKYLSQSLSSSTTSLSRPQFQAIA